MKLLPIVGALLLSATPVQASKTPEELLKPCEASEEAEIACKSASMLVATSMTFAVLCGLMEKGIIPPDSLPDDIAEPPVDYKDYQKLMWALAIERVLQENPNCPIKPIP